MFELERRGNVRKIKYLEFSNICKIAIPAITEIIKLAKQNVEFPTFEDLSWYGRAIQISSKRTISRKESLNILASAFGLNSYWDMVKKNKSGKVNVNPDFDPNDNYVSIYVNDQGKHTHVGITYVSGKK